MQAGKESPLCGTVIVGGVYTTLGFHGDLALSSLPGSAVRARREEPGSIFMRGSECGSHDGQACGYAASTSKNAVRVCIMLPLKSLLALGNTGDLHVQGMLQRLLTDCAEAGIAACC